MKVTLLMALTLDGRIALDSEHKADWTEKADKKIFAELTKRAGVVIMGSKTYDTIGKPLPNRKNIVLTRNCKGRINASPTNKDLIFTDAAPKEILAKLTKEKFTEAILVGGQAVNTLFAKAGLIDRIVVTISPIIFGKGLSLFDETISLKLQLEKLERLGDNSVLAEYKVLT